MKKKEFKTIYIEDGVKKLKNVNGYFIKIEEVPVFIYRGTFNWYVVDVKTGLSISDGEYKYVALNNASKKIPAFKNYQDTEKYTKLRFEYQRLLKDN